MIELEYKNSIGKIERRDVEIGRVQSTLRKEYWSQLSSRFEELVHSRGGGSFSTRIVGSVDKGLATPESDIDILIIAHPQMTQYEKDCLTIATLLALQDLRIEQKGKLLYRFDLWFEKDEVILSRITVINKQRLQFPDQRTHP
jgi:predicted nucleotidyltransferase